MTRRLPWKRTASSLGDSDANKLKKRSEPERKNTSSATKAESCVKEQDSGSDGDDIRPAQRTSSSASNAAKTTPGIFSDDRASSPPPEPLGEVYMKPGIDADDRYRMVEDEFLATAQQFTAHMRAAEYKRLISASRTRNANTIKDISRPVVGRMTDLVRMKTERKARSEKIRREVREKKMKRVGKEEGQADSGDVDEDGDTGDEELYGSTSLLGLMENPNPRKKMAPRLEAASSGISRPGGEGTAADMPMRTSPTVVTKVEAVPRPTFTSIPGLSKKRSAENYRQKQGQQLVDDDNDDASTDSDEDLDKPSRIIKFPKTTPRSETKSVEMNRSMRPANTSIITSTSSTSATASVRKHIREDVAVQRKVSSSTAKESGTKSSDPADSDDDDYDVLASLKSRRASAKRRSTGRGGGLGFG